MNIKYTQAALVGLFLCGCGAFLAALQPAVCPDPPPRFGGAPLITCQSPNGDHKTMCCAYGRFDNNHSSGDLCFDMLCKSEPCSEFTFTETICTPPEVPLQEAFNQSFEEEQEDYWYYNEKET